MFESAKSSADQRAIVSGARPNNLVKKGKSRKFKEIIIVAGWVGCMPGQIRWNHYLLSLVSQVHTGIQVPRDCEDIQGCLGVLTRIYLSLSLSLVEW
jgi:hypothetical protein